MASFTKIALYALVSLLTPEMASATTTVISLDRAPSFGERGTDGNTVVLKEVGAFAHITSIAYSLSVEALSPSWLYDQQAWFGSSDSVEATFTPGFNNYEEGVAKFDGVVDLVAMKLDFLLNEDAQIRLELINKYDPLDTPTGFWTGTFTITSEDTANDSAVAEPATWAMMITGFGVVGASLRRRRITFPASARQGRNFYS